MINRELFYSAAHNKIMDIALTVIAEEAFFSGLPYEFSELEKKEKLALHEYVSTAVEQLGGANTILKGAMEQFEKTDRAKYLYTKKMYEVCTEAAAEVAARVTEELEEKSSFENALADTNFTEDEFRKFETSAEKLDLQDVGQIVGEKVIATIKSEQETAEAEQALTDQINELSEEKNPTDAESAKESFYQLALDTDDPRHHVSLFSKLYEVATEAMAALYPEEANANLCEFTINDITFLYGLDSYKRPVSALEALERLVNLDGAVINNGELQEVAVESLQNGSMSKSAFVAAATAYTLIETMNTLNLHTPSKTEIDKFMYTRSEYADYANKAVESFVGQAGTIFKNFERELREMNDVDSLKAYRHGVDIMETKIANIGVATEGFLQCKLDLQQQIKTVGERIDSKIKNIEAPAPARTPSLQVAFEQDTAALQRLYSLYGRREGVDSVKIIADNNNSKNVEIQILDAMESVMTSRNITLEGLNKPTNEYLSEILANNGFKTSEKKIVFRTKRDFSGIVL